MAKKKNSINRRTFLKVGSAGAAYALGNSLLGINKAHAATSNKVYVASDPGFISGTTVNGALVRTGIDCLVKAMTGQSSVGAAWEALVPGTVTAASKIAMKLNVMMTFNSPQLSTLQGVVNGMKQMLGGTYPGGNIAAFDNDFSRREGVSLMHRTYGATELDKLGIWYPDTRNIGAIQYGPKTIYIYDRNYMPPQKLDEAQLGISMVNVRPHQYYAGYLSGVIKNMMGCVSLDPASYLKGQMEIGWNGPVSAAFHNKTSFKGFVDMFKNYMGSKIGLYIADLLFLAPHEDSPQTRIEKKIAMGTDPCAVDSYCVDIFNKYPENNFSLANKGVPSALAAAGLGTTSYQLVNVPVTTGPTPVTAADVQKAIKDHKDGKKSVAEVQAIADKYMKGESL